MDSYKDDAGFGYTLATGRLFMPSFADFHKGCEELMGHSILTHEFASEEVWKKMREKFESTALASVQ